MSENTNNATVGNLSLVRALNETDTIFVEIDGSMQRISVKDFMANTANNDYALEHLAYGVWRDKSSSSKDWQRIGSSNLHRKLPIHKGMLGVLKQDNGEQVYLPTTDWSGADLSGASGQVMVEIPSHYMLYEETETHEIRYVSVYPLPGFELIPTMYVGSMEGTIKRSENKLCSVANTSADYRGGNNSDSYDSEANTYLGRPATSISMTNFRTYARNHGGGSKWNQGFGLVRDVLYNLAIIEFATSDFQKAINNELTAEGFRQGGLGLGVTNVNYDDWNTFNGRYPFVPCGWTANLGNGTGEREYTATANDINITVKANRYRGIENPFGHIYEWCDGVIIDVKTDADGGTSKAYVCDNPANFSSTSTLNYTYVGDVPRTEGYIKAMIGGKRGCVLPSEVGASSSTYFCDMFYTNTETSELRGVLSGGHASLGSGAGLAYSFTGSAPSYSYTCLGSRLCYFDHE